MNIKSLADIKRLKTKKKILARFKMNGCHYCEETQSDWDKICRQVKNKMTPDSVIAEIESEFTDSFLNQLDLVDNTGMTPQVQGYPTYMIIVNGVATPQQGRSEIDLMRALSTNKFMKKKKTRKIRR